jgi:serine/threonine protein phosphatase PrpC
VVPCLSATFFQMCAGLQGCLAVSRAFGDRTLQPFVIADPHVQARELDPDVDSFFYLASDGVTGG